MYLQKFHLVIEVFLGFAYSF